MMSSRTNGYSMPCGGRKPLIRKRLGHSLMAMLLRYLGRSSHKTVWLRGHIWLCCEVCALLFVHQSCCIGSDWLAEPDSRERAFHSGIVELALSKRFLPDELVYWIFHSSMLVISPFQTRCLYFLVPSESRDELRHVYCRVFKVGLYHYHSVDLNVNSKLTDCQNATAERIKSLIRPDDVDQVFQRLGASPKALAITESVSPDSRKQQQSFLFNVRRQLRPCSGIGFIAGNTQQSRSPTFRSWNASRSSKLVSLSCTIP